MFADSSFNLFNEPLDWFVDNFYKDDEYFSLDKRKVFENILLKSDEEIKEVVYESITRQVNEITTPTINDFDTVVNFEEIAGVFENTDIGDDEYAELIGHFTGGVTKVSFEYKVSSEQDFDFLTISVNGSEVVNVSGEVDWTYKEVDVVGGDLSFSAIYSKDGSNSEGADKGYIRNLQITKSYTANGFVADNTIKREFQTLQNIAIYNIKDFLNLIHNSKFEIKWYKEIKNFTFERIGFIQIPPKRVIIKDFDE